MKKIALKGKYFTDLERAPLKDEKDAKLMIGKVTGNLLVGGAQKGKDVAKLYSLGLRFYEAKDFELDDPDIDLVKEIVNGSEQFSVLVKAQILLLLDSAKEVSKK